MASDAEGSGRRGWPSAAPRPKRACPVPEGATLGNDASEGDLVAGKFTWCHRSAGDA